MTCSNKEKIHCGRTLFFSLSLLVLVACGGSNEPDSAPSGSAALAPDTPNTQQLTPQQSTLPREEAPLAADAEIGTAADSVSRFGSSLFSEWMSWPENAQSNFVFSPLSLYSALLMTQAGAENETLQQMSAVLRLNVTRQQANANFNALDLALEGQGQRAGEGKLRNVNGLFLEKTQAAQQPFLDSLALYFGAGVFLFDTSSLAAVEASRINVNTWFKEQTAGKFSDFLPPGVLDDARLILANAVMFQGAWQQPFDSNLTKIDDFQLATGTLKSVQFMEQSAVVSVKRDVNYDAVALPFAGGDFTLQLVVPKLGQFQTIEAVLRSNPEFNFLEDSNLSFVLIKMPKFDFETILPAENLLSRLGMNNAFDPAQADFSGINGKGELYISKVIHKAVIKVDEQGAEASAGSTVVLTPPSVPGETIAIDRPFFFVIRDVKTGLLTFIGRVMDPSL